MRLILALLPLAFPLCAQLTVTCPAPGTVAILTWSDPAHPSVFARIEPNLDGRTTPHSFPAPGFEFATMQAGPTTTGTATFPTKPGPWIAYYFQNSPYVESKAEPFQCEPGPPSPPTPTPTPTPTPVPTPSPAASCTRVTVSGTEVGVCISDIEIVLQCQASGSFSFSVIAPGKAILQIPVGTCP